MGGVLSLLTSWWRRRFSRVPGQLLCLEALPHWPFHRATGANWQRPFFVGPLIQNPPQLSGAESEDLEPERR